MEFKAFIYFFTEPAQKTRRERLSRVLIVSVESNIFSPILLPIVSISFLFSKEKESYSLKNE